MRQEIRSASLKPNGKALWVFGDDVLPLNLAFSGTVVPEKSPLMCIDFLCWCSLMRSAAKVGINRVSLYKSNGQKKTKKKHSRGQAYGQVASDPRQGHQSCRKSNTVSQIFHFLLADLASSFSPATSLLLVAFRQKSVLLNNPNNCFI